MKQLKKILKELERQGFRITYNDGSRMKLYPPIKEQPLYSLHFGGDQARFALVRFARKEWGLDLESLI